MSSTQTQQSPSMFPTHGYLCLGSRHRSIRRVRTRIRLNIRMSTLRPPIVTTRMLLPRSALSGCSRMVHAHGRARWFVSFTPVANSLQHQCACFFPPRRIPESRPFATLLLPFALVPFWHHQTVLGVPLLFLQSQPSSSSALLSCPFIRRSRG